MDYFNLINVHFKLALFTKSFSQTRVKAVISVPPHMHILAQGYPEHVWDNIMSHMHMGVQYKYTCMIMHSYTTYTPGINFYTQN